MTGRRETGSPEDVFDGVTRLLARLLRAPVAVVTLRDQDQQRLASKVGLTVSETRRAIAFCDQAILSGEPLIVPDTLADARFARAPLAASGPRIRFYAGAPLVTPEGFGVGTLSAFDYVPRQLSGDEVDTLCSLARQVVTVLELRARAAALEQRLAAGEERYRALEMALRRREQEFGALVDHAPDSVMRFDKAFRHIHVNAAAERAGGIPPAGLVGKTHRELGLPLPLCELWEGALQRVFTSGQETVIEFDLPRPGSISSFEARLAPEHRSDGSVETVLVVSRDVSRRRLLEEQLRQSQRMEAVGKLAGGVAHDFNNLLTVIQGRADIVRAKLEPGHPLRRDAELIHTAAERGAMLTRQLLAFSRKQVLKPKILDPATVVDGMASMLRRVIGEDIDLRIEHGPRGGYVEADPGQIEQLIMNLAVNARDAMPGGGRLTIATSEVELEATGAARYGDVAPGPHVRLSVSDTGCGMDADTRAHLFEPFFTTKEPGKGTGLGLSTVYGIVQQHGGSVAVESEIGRGSTFMVFLPRLAAGATELSPAEDALEPPRGAETVLLVEDEDQVRAFARETLEMTGYRVLEAPDPGTALRLAREHAGAIHVLLTDLVMPELSGRELAERVKGLRPGVRVAYMSGYTDDAIIAHAVRDRDASFLQKPFGRRSLARLVREALDRPHAEAG